MDLITLNAIKREESGSRPARRLRREGLVPAVVYGAGVEALSVAVERRELYRTLHTESGGNAVISLVIDGGDTITAVAREIQRHPYRGTISHLDFIKVDLDHEIDAEVHIEYIGTPIGVKEDGSIVEVIMAAVGVRALPGNVPTAIEVDISHLVTGSSIKARGLPEIDGVEYTDPVDHTLVTVLAKRGVEETEESDVEGDDDEEEFAVEDAADE